MDARHALAGLCLAMVLRSGLADAQMPIVMPGMPPFPVMPGPGAAAPPIDPNGCETIAVYPPGRREPGRDGMHTGPRPGAFDIQAYPGPHKPQLRLDAPPQEMRRALLFAPLDQVPHTAAQNFPAGFQGVIGHDTLGCLAASLTKAGYNVDPNEMRGRLLPDGAQVHTGLDAIVELYQHLRSQKYAVLYLMTHGAAVEASGDDPADVLLTMGYMQKPQVEALDSQAIREGSTLDIVARNRVLVGMGMQPGTDDANAFRKTIAFDQEDSQGRIKVQLKASFFQLLRARSGVRFDQTLVLPVVCESGANAALRKAFQAKSFFGWENSPNTSVAVRAGEQIFDLLRDQGRTVRQAWQVWFWHTNWYNKEHHLNDAASQPTALHAYGSNGLEYSPIAENSQIFIFYGRNEGGDTTKAALPAVLGALRGCLAVWATGKRAPPHSGLCPDLEASTIPTTDEVDDAAYELGDGDGNQHGWKRMTLTDD